METSLAMPAPGLDISMKKAINTVIRTKLQEQEEQEEKEREIGLVTQVNPKVPSTENPLNQIQECYHQGRRKQPERGVSQP